MLHKNWVADEAWRLVTLNVPENERWRVIAVTDRLPVQHVPPDVCLDRLQNSLQAC